MKIAIWLRELGLETYEPAFRDNHIDVETLKTLRATDLEELGVTSLAHRKLLLNAIASLRNRRRRARGGVPPAGRNGLRRLDPTHINGAGLLQLPVPVRRPPEMLEQERPTPLVGREAELGTLLRAWRRAGSGAGEVILLRGAPGIGKSRLLRTLRERLADTPHTTLSHYCAPERVDSALYPIIGLLERAAGLAREDGPGQRLAKLAALLAQGPGRLDEAVPLIGELLGIDPGPHHPPPRLAGQRRRERTLSVLLEQIEGLARRHAVLAIYEDLHWADPSTLELLDLMVDRIRHLPVLAVMTFRPGFAVPWAGRSHVAELPLARLGRAGARAIVEHLTAREPASEPLVEQILLAADGVPLMVEELTRAVFESGLAPAAHVPGEVGRAAPAAVPSSLQDALVARLDRMPQAGEVARIAAALGREFSIELLAAVADRPEGELREVVDRLVASDLVLLRRPPPQAVYAFRHGLLRDAVYEGTTQSLRQSLHARIARVLEERSADLASGEPELLARHYAGAGLIEGAIGCRLRAAAHACERSAHAEAVGHLCRGLELLDGLPPAPDYRFERLSLLAALGQTLARARGYAAPEVEQACDLARTLCREAEETPELFPIVRGLCDYYQTRADHESARELAARCERLAAGGPEQGRLIDAHLCQGLSALFTGELPRAHEHLTRSVVLHDAQRDRAAGHPLETVPRAVALVHLAQTLWLRGLPDQAVCAGDEAMTTARAAGQPFALACALLCASWLHQLMQDPATTRVLAAEAIACSVEEDLPAFFAMATILHAWALPEPPGSPAVGTAETMREALSRYRATGSDLARPYLLALLADVHAGAGDLEGGLRALAEALEASRSTGERWYEPELCRQEGLLLLRRSIANRRGASACFCQALALARQQGSRSLELRAAVDLARLWAALHRRSEARGMLEPVYNWFTEGFETADLKDAKALLDELR